MLPSGRWATPRTAESLRFLMVPRSVTAIPSHALQLLPVSSVLVNPDSPYSENHFVPLADYLIPNIITHPQTN